MATIRVRAFLEQASINKQWLSSVETLTTFLVSAPPYASIDLTVEQHAYMQEALHLDGVRFDAWCVDCGRDATFSVGPFFDAAKTLGLKQSANEQAKVRSRVGEGVEAITQEPDAVWARLICRCARANHPLTFAIHIDYVWVRNDDVIVRLTKFGQLPAMADMIQGEIEKYRRVLDDRDYRELNRAVGLASHDIGIGSFIYLRRIFERAVQETIDVATTDDGRRKELRALPMDQRIRELRDHLPKFLVENATLYAILSKGVHELEEQQCLDAFDTVKVGIEVILDQRLAAKEQEAKIKAAGKSINALHSALKGAQE